MKIIGPFSKILTLENLPLRGKISDQEIISIPNAGILINPKNLIQEIGDYNTLLTKNSSENLEIIKYQNSTNLPTIVLPAYIDCHTHICFAGNRANDFAMRNSGKSYLEIAEKGGGIWSSVLHTRSASEEELLETLLSRIHQHILQGITTIEIKSGYGLDLENELKILRVIQKAQQQTKATLVPTCLAAHLIPKDFCGNSEKFLHIILQDILPKIQTEKLSNRVDIFIEKSAFQPKESLYFLQKAKQMGFQVTVHADQFTPGGSQIAIEVGALSADHLEASTELQISLFGNTSTVAVALPGASLGLGEPFAPARKLLDSNAILAIATDYNPGSAPMGQLIAQASILATFQKLSTAETFAGITFRAAKALNLDDRGILANGKKADFIVYETENYQNILYQQGRLQPSAVYIDGKKV